MKKTLFVGLICFCAFTSMAPDNNNNFFSDDKKFPSLLSTASDESPAVTNWIDSVYNSIKLDSFGLNKNTFFLACKGYQFLLSKNKLQNTSLLTICDYSQCSTKKRLYVIDLVQGTILFNTYVSHGKNSGSDYATSFSNRPETHKSSLGFMVTGETYSGQKGYSLHLDGMEPGINDKVRSRNIVMHGSNYVNENRADEGDAMGRSFGCPAVSYSVYKKIIDKIKNGSCFFVFADDKFYTSTSKILNARFSWPLAITEPVADIVSN
ncbi:MAG TPA: murein L,D-transpeptidase catalytic domain family protein [Panacibacter sp.]|nr:murein L,D-transpeptidase catalytic domain family protein [Panacibacter sp.]